MRRKMKTSGKEYEKDKNEVTIKLGVALMQIAIGYPDIAFDCIEEAQEILSKYVGITEEQRKHLEELEYNLESGLIVSTDKNQRESAGPLGKYRLDPRRAPKRQT